ncbi:aminomethyl-transferring glycine dehydrogenase subunit GcvPA [uncultured Cloacibacillus sp.]|uniref:aminomethyl-transferring glycine dehydrogenase subunit GcvPA n=1 Tax=uncultured Cloacibacillus sp. TaxID=889794 RepID=UPI002583DF12|nr:aminomethyl-transferring glycine dehydrogenase subunit GcvPA [uncultured Cloacibacillus sp.]
MGSYVPSTMEQRLEMLKAVGVASFDELYADVPESMRLKEGALDLPDGMSEMEVLARMKEMAGKNKVFPSIFRGAGAYCHYIPSIVKRITSKEEFVTAYTPYQSEISQGILQSIFEYQTMICELTGMDASNASVYDVETAAAEAAAMCHDRKRSKVVVSGAAHPDVIKVMRTYCFGSNSECVVVPPKDGGTDLEALKAAMDDATSCVYVQQPSFSGILEDCTAAAEAAHAAGAKFIMGINPIAAAIVKTPAECGADIAVGEGQPLGIPMGFGGPYLGFMACTEKMQRKLPGRIVGQTSDAKGNRCFVLTLQAREQHIRREKASSNICSNEALCALTAAVYMAVMGPEGMRKTAEQCFAKAHYLAARITSLPGFKMVNPGEFFHEFVTTSPVCAKKLLDALEEKGILGGLPVEGGILWCATEMNGTEQIEELVSVLKEVSGK